MSKDNVEDMKHCKDCNFYARPKCKHKEVNTFTARKNSCAYHTPKRGKGKARAKSKQVIGC